METISPTAVPSSSRRPSRSQSTRTSAVPPTPHRSGSTSSRPSASRPLDNLPKRDAETTNVARSRRSSTSKDRPLPNRTDSTRSRQHKSSSQPHDNHHYQPDMSANAVAQGSGPAPVPAAPESKHSSSKAPRSRTTIPAKTGNWVLGKTIGAGSMGKVKLARRAEGGEQVRYI